MHRPRVSRNQQRQPFEHRGEHHEIGVRGSVNNGTSDGHAARMASSTGLSPVEPMSKIDAPRDRASSAPTSAKRAGSHS
jgi:hypothetical protein